MLDVVGLAGRRLLGEVVGEALHVTIANRGRLHEGFDPARRPGGVSGLGLVRALLPRRSASPSIVQDGAQVLATVTLDPPSITRLEPA